MQRRNLFPPKDDDHVCPERDDGRIKDVCVSGVPPDRTPCIWFPPCNAPQHTSETHTIDKQPHLGQWKQPPTCSSASPTTLHTLGLGGLLINKNKKTKQKQTKQKNPKNSTVDES